MINTKTQKCSLAFVYNNVFYPFTYPEILESLKEHKYSVGMPAGLLPSGARIYLGGQIAKRGNCTVTIKEDSKLLSTEGTSIDEVISSAKDLVDIAKNDFNLNIKNDLNYLELVADFIVKTHANPTRDIQRFVGDKLSIFNDITGEATSSYLINLAPKGADSSSQKWFDIRIEPRSTSPKSSYYINVVYRDRDVDNVLDFTQGLSNKILAIVNRIGEA